VLTPGEGEVEIDEQRSEFEAAARRLRGAPARLAWARRLSDAELADLVEHARDWVRTSMLGELTTTDEFLTSHTASMKQDDALVKLYAACEQEYDERKAHDR
jgi:hypothetical protein